MAGGQDDPGSLIGRFAAADLEAAIGLFHDIGDAGIEMIGSAVLQDAGTDVFDNPGEAVGADVGMRVDQDVGMGAEGHQLVQHLPDVAPLG